MNFANTTHAKGFSEESQQFKLAQMIDENLTRLFKVRAEELPNFTGLMATWNFLDGILFTIESFFGNDQSMTELVAKARAEMTEIV